MIEEVTVNCLFLQAEITYDGPQSIRFHLNIGYASLCRVPYRALSHMCSRSSLTMVLWGSMSAPFHR